MPGADPSKRRRTMGMEVDKSGPSTGPSTPEWINDGKFQCAAFAVDKIPRRPFRQRLRFNVSGNIASVGIGPVLL